MEHMLEQAKHLSKKEKVNYGSYYTPQSLIGYIEKLIHNNINIETLNKYLK